MTADARSPLGERSMRAAGGPIAVIAAAPGRGHEPVVAACREVAPVELWSPLATPGWLTRAPGPLGRFAARRHAPHDVAAPALLAVDAGLRAWAGDRTDRRYRAEFVRRGAIDAWGAREVRRRRPRMVIASSLAARRTFAAAREIGAATVLVLDLPVLRALHRDLDRAAAVWPAREFLRRFRAPSWAIACQEAERVLADLVIVRGPYARELCLADGIPASRLALAPAAPPPRGPTCRAGPAPLRLRLAGLAAARHGVDTALEVARALDAVLVVRTGEGTEPADLAHLPHVAIDDDPVDAVICPAICETYAPELRVTGVPVIASPMASLDGTGPDPYDAAAFATAIRNARTRGAPLAPPLAPRLAALL